MKVIFDTNLWISFLIGHQTQFVRRMLTDMRFDVYVCSQLINEIRDVASREKIRKYIDFLKANEEFETEFFKKGDGISVSRKRVRS